MRLTGFILFLSIPACLPAQYYFTGEVKDPHGDKLQNVSIAVQSDRSVYRTGIYGDFRIISSKSDDTLTFSVDGYEPYTTAIAATGFLQITLKTKPLTGNSFAGGAMNRQVASVIKGTAVSFSGSANGTSYSYIRRFLDLGTTVPPDAVKIEEMLNYFNFYYEEPDKEDLFHCSSNLVSCPWNAAHKLLYLNICARKVDRQNTPPGNLVFLIDASGSMDMPNKLPLVKSAFRLLVKNLRDIDTVSLVEYGRDVRVVLGGIPGSEKKLIIRALEGLEPDGPTPGETGIRLAYKVAQRQFIAGGNNRIILITDGDINEGISTENELEDYIEQQNQAGIHLSCLGIGMDSSKDSRLAMLAKKGQGHFACIENVEEAENTLINELAPAKFAVADNVCVTTDFNPGLVKEYRLIGFDNRKGVVGDTAFRLEGSRIRSCHSVLALFELTPREDSTGLTTVAEVKISYCLPGQHAGQTMSYSCPNEVLPFDKAEITLKREACIALFGMKLRESGYAAQISWPDLQKMAKKNFSENYFMDKEYLSVVAKAKKIYERTK